MPPAAKSRARTPPLPCAPTTAHTQICQNVSFAQTFAGNLANLIDLSEDELDALTSLSVRTPQEQLLRLDVTGFEGKNVIFSLDTQTDSWFPTPGNGTAVTPLGGEAEIIPDLSVDHLLLRSSHRRFPAIVCTRAAPLSDKANQHVAKWDTMQQCQLLQASALDEFENFFYSMPAELEDSGRRGRQLYFDSLWNSAKSAYNAVAGNPPSAPVSSGSTSSSQPPKKKGALSQFSNSLTQVIDTILVQVESLQDALITALEEAFGIVEDALRGISNLVEGEINKLLNDYGKVCPKVKCKDVGLNSKDPADLLELFNGEDEEDDGELDELGVGGGNVLTHHAMINVCISLSDLKIDPEPMLDAFTGMFDNNGLSETIRKTVNVSHGDAPHRFAPVCSALTPALCERTGKRTHQRNHQLARGSEGKC